MATKADELFRSFSSPEQKILQRVGESDPSKQEELAAWLHDLGIALNYGRDPRLRDTTVLRPDWLANAIYVLRANDSRHEKPLAREGIVTPESRPSRSYSAARSAQHLP